MYAQFRHRVNSGEVSSKEHVLLNELRTFLFCKAQCVEGPDGSLDGNRNVNRVHHFKYDCIPHGPWFRSARQTHEVTTHIPHHGNGKPLESKLAVSPSTTGPL